MILNKNFISTENLFIPNFDLTKDLTITVDYKVTLQAGQAADGGFLIGLQDDVNYQDGQSAGPGLGYSNVPGLSVYDTDGNIQLLDPPGITDGIIGIGFDFDGNYGSNMTGTGSAGAILIPVFSNILPLSATYSNNVYSSYVLYPLTVGDIYQLVAYTYVWATDDIFYGTYIGGNFHSLGSLNPNPGVPVNFTSTGNAMVFVRSGGQNQPISATVTDITTPTSYLTATAAPNAITIRGPTVSGFPFFTTTGNLSVNETPYHLFGNNTGDRNRFRIRFTDFGNTIIVDAYDFTLNQFKNYLKYTWNCAFDRCGVYFAYTTQLTGQQLEVYNININGLFTDDYISSSTYIPT